MGYSNIAEVDLFLAQALTSANPTNTTSGLSKLININNTRDLNRIPNATVEYYISTSDSQIDGILTQQYYTPFKKCANGQWNLDENINVPVTSSSGSPTDSSGDSGSTLPPNTVVIDSSINLVPGDEIVIHNDLTGEEEFATVATIVDQYTFTVTADLEGIFLATDGVRIIRNQFPPPLNQISARLAASAIYDKYFAAQADPNRSDYGKELRIMAIGALNDILAGKIHLKCARRRGDIFGNPWIDSSHSLNDQPFGFNSTERSMSRPQT